MRRIELLKQRHDFKIALRRAKIAVAKNDPPNEMDYALEKRKDKVRTQLRRKLKIASFKNNLRRAHNCPCSHNESQWFTFSDPNCYNQLDEVIVKADRIKRNFTPISTPNETKSSTFKTYMNNIDWWDGSIEDPWPETKWSWFEDRLGGHKMWGTGGGTIELGNKKGKNGVVGKPYYMDEWVIPGGGGGNMKFWAHLNNWSKYGVKGVQTLSGAIDQGNALRGEFEKLYPVVSNDSIVEITTYNPESTHINSDGKVDAVYSNFYKRDTIINKNQIKNLQKFIRQDSLKFQKEVNDILDGKKTID